MKEGAVADIWMGRGVDPGRRGVLCTLCRSQLIKG